MYSSSTMVDTLVGTASPMSANQQFKDDIASIYDSYANEGVNVFDSLGTIAQDKNLRQAFVDMAVESVENSEAFHTGDASSDPFYSTYTDRLKQLEDNSLLQMARESVMTGYAPIQSYAPFLIKRQWVSCVWKDALMADVAKSPIVKLQMEQRWVKDGSGNRYQIPDVYYKKDLMKHLLSDATGIALKEDLKITLPLQNECLISAENSSKYYSEPLEVRDAAEVLTHDYTIYKVVFVDKASKEHEVYTDIKLDVATGALINGEVTCTVFNDDGSIKETLKDVIVGNVDCRTGCVSAYATHGNVKFIYHKGKAAGRFNHRSLSVERTIKPLTFYMPESGPRLNAAVTVEEAQDAIACGNIDLYADNTDMMGDVLANLQDIDIKMFVDDSFERNKNAKSGPLGYDECFIEEGSFSAVPIQNFGITIDAWMNQAKEYFERLLSNLKFKLKTQNAIVCAVCHPKLVRYLKSDVRWIFNDETGVSGLKLNYNVGVTNVDGDRVHIITSMYKAPEEGVRLIVIPTTTECVTFKHLMYSVIVDRGYRNPVESLVPNVMSTQRTMTFEVTPVQGDFLITGTDAHAPTTYNGSIVANVTQTAAAGGASGDGDRS